jgi:hypothetical protein
MFHHYRTLESLARTIRSGAAGAVRITAAACLTAVLLAPAKSLLAEPAVDRDNFIAAYQCEITLRLVVMHRLGKPTREDNRYLILSLRDAPGHYAQCVYFDNDQQMMCEVASGYFTTAEGEPPLFHLSDDRVAALGALGFSTDASHGNYRKAVEMKGAESYGETGRLLLSTVNYAVSH